MAWVWNTSAGATSYDLYRDGSPAGNVIGAAAIFRNQTPNTDFTFTVRARNNSGVSGHSAAFTVRTLASGTTLEVSTNRIFVPANGNSHPVTVTSNAIWSITRSHEWITPSVNGGNNTGTFNVSVDPNVELSERTGTITVAAGIFRWVIYVMQAGIGSFVWPTVSRSIQREQTSYHDGIDIQPVTWRVPGDDVFAFMAGTVSAVTNPSGNPREGYSVRIHHVNPLQNGHAHIRTQYMHLHGPPLVAQGDQVYAGQLIGHMGNSGFVIPAPTAEEPWAGTHLHFEVRGGTAAQFPLGGTSTFGTGTVLQVRDYLDLTD